MFSDLVGLPWRDRGRVADEYDCYGLFRAGFTAGTGIVLPSHADDYRTAADRAETAQKLAGEMGNGGRSTPARNGDSTRLSCARRDGFT